jgi:hypothetical protein
MLLTSELLSRVGNPSAHIPEATLTSMYCFLVTIYFAVQTIDIEHDWHIISLWRIQFPERCFASVTTEHLVVIMKVK